MPNLSLALEPPAFETQPGPYPCPPTLAHLPSCFGKVLSRFSILAVSNRSLCWSRYILHPPFSSPSSGILSSFGRGMILESSQFKKRVCLRSRMLQIRLRWISPVMITFPISIIDRPILDPPDRRVTNRIRDSPFIDSRREILLSWRFKCVIRPGHLFRIGVVMMRLIPSGPG